MNPYHILNLERNAAKKDIIQAAAKAMRERKFSAKEIAIAQKTLLNQSKRVSNIFKHLDFASVIDNLSIKKPSAPSDACLKAPLKF